MKCLIVSCVYPPEPVISAVTSSQIAEELTRRGHETTVVAPFPSRPGGHLYEGYQRRLFERSQGAGLSIVRCFSFLSRRSSLASRSLEALSFAVTSALVALRLPRADVAYVNSWPILGSGLTTLILRWKRTPIVLSVQDVYPESLVAQGRIRAGGFLSRAIERVDRAIARRSAAVIVISETLRAEYGRTRGLAAPAVHVIRNWGDESRFESDSAKTQELRRRMGIAPDAFLLVYGGNVGVAAGVDCVIEALRRLGSHRVALLVAGDGTELERCRRLAASLAHGRVAFLNPWPAEETGAVLGSADLLILPTQGRQSLSSVPSKLTSYMLAGKPILASAVPGSDLASVIEKSGAGWTVEPDRPEALSEKIGEILRLSPKELAERGQRGRYHAEKEMSARDSVEAVAELLERASATPWRG